jgi:hypothetical protein
MRLSVPRVFTHAVLVAIVVARRGRVRRVREMVKKQRENNQSSYTHTTPVSRRPFEYPAAFATD